MISKVHTIVKVLKCYNLFLMILKIMNVSLLNRFRYNFKDVPVMYYLKVLENKQPKLEENILLNINVPKSDTQVYTNIFKINHQLEDHSSQIHLTQVQVIKIIAYYNKLNSIVILHLHLSQPVEIVKNIQLHNNILILINYLILIWQYRRVYTLIRLYQLQIQMVILTCM